MKYTVTEFAEVFTEVLSNVARVFDAAGVPWMLVGGLAVGAWTEPRATRDADFAIALPDEPRPLADALRAVGFDVGADLLACAAQGGPVRIRLDRPGALPLIVDLLCAGTPFEHEALARRRSADLLGVALHIASPDDLLIYKLIAGRPQDLADIDRLIRFGRTPENDDYVRRWAREWDVEALLDRAIEQARRDA